MATEMPSLPLKSLKPTGNFTVLFLETLALVIFDKAFVNFVAISLSKICPVLFSELGLLLLGPEFSLLLGSGPGGMLLLFLEGELRYVLILDELGDLFG